MEACMMKPEVKKKQQPPKPPPKPTEMKRSDPERLERPTPLVPPRPTDEANGDSRERGTKDKPAKTVVELRPLEKELKTTTRYRQCRREAEATQSSRDNDLSEVLKHNKELKESNQTVLTGMFRRSQKEKTPSFTSYVNDDCDKEQKTEDVPDKLAPGSKQGVLKGAMKGLQFKPSPKASREPSPDEGVDPEMEHFTEKHKQETNAEPKQDKGGLIAGIFRKTPKEKSSSPAQKVHKTDSDPEDTGETEEKSSDPPYERGGFFSGILKKSNKTTDETPAQENLRVNSELSASNDSLSGNNGTKEKVGIFGGMFKKSPKPPEAAQTDEDKLSIPDNLSDSHDNLSENSKQESGVFLSGILRKSPKIPREGTPGQSLNQSESDEALSENNTSKEKGGIFSSMFKKSPKLSEAPLLEEGAESLHSELSASTDSLSENKEKGSLFSGLLKKTPKTSGENLSAQKDLSASNDSLSESAYTKEKGGMFGGMFKKSLRRSDSSPTEEEESQDDELSGSSEALCETKEKGGIFSGIFKKTPKPAEAARPEENESSEDKLSTSTENLFEDKREKSGGLLSGLLRKPPKASGEKTELLDREAQRELSASNDELSENNSKLKEKKGGLAGIFKRSASIDDLFDEEKGGLFSGLIKKNLKASGDEAAAEDKDRQKQLMASNDSLSENNNTKDREAQRELSASNDELSENNTKLKEKKGGLAGIFKRSASIDDLFDEEKGGLFSGLIKKNLKASGDEAAAEDKDSQKQLMASNDSLSENNNTKEKSIFSGMFKKTHKPAEEAKTDEVSNTGEDKKLSASYENLLEETTSKEKTGGLAGIFKKSPKPAPRSVTTEDPLSQSKELYSSCDSLIENPEDELGELSNSNDNLSEAASTTKEKKGGLAGIFKRTPKTAEHQESVDLETPEGGGLRRRRTIKKKKRVVSFRVKKTLSKIPKSDQISDKMPILEETVELQELNPAQESSVEVQPVEMAAYPIADNPVEAEQESDELMEWWNTVKGWAEWNETNNFQEDDEEMAMEQAADRVYMAARLFVRLFNQRGASLQHRILELVALADTADQFHKKTVTAAVGGGVASVAGSVATITGLILAPFTFGASVIVTAVGIGVATAGSITSATANITDTVHSNMDRKKLEKMIQGYQDEIKVIRECLEFVQAGMDTLQEWDFEKYTQSAAKKALNHNLKHVMKEGGRAGKALMINTDKLISTVQILGAAGGAAKAAQAISVTTGVMSALFLALDVFFLAKDSHELRKGAKTKFATKIRDVCKELQDGLLELNKVKTQLQKTMDGIEVEEYEEIEEVEVEVDDDFEADPKKLAELEQELDLMEEKLDKKAEEEHRKRKESEKENITDKKEKSEKSVKDKEEPKEKKKKEEEEKGKKETKKGKGEKEQKPELKLENSDEGKEQKNENAKEGALKEQSQKERKKDKETENYITAAKEKYESKRDTTKEDSGPKNDVKEKEKNKTGKELEKTKSRSGDSRTEDRSGKAHSERVKTERENERSKSSKNDERVMSKEKEVGVHGGIAAGVKERADTKMRETDAERDSRKQSDRTESWRRRTEEERGARDRRGETAKTKERRKSEEGRDSKREPKREDDGRHNSRKESQRSHHTAARREHPERERGSTREESDSRRSHSSRGAAPREEERGSRNESMRKQFERAGEEEERRRWKEDGASRRRGESDRERERGHGDSGPRARSTALLEDGLYI